MKKFTYTHDESQLAEIFETLKKGRCDECNQFCHMLVPPYMVKHTIMSHTNQETGKVHIREYRTGFIQSCETHTLNGVGAWVPSGTEGVDWKIEDETYFVREKVQGDSKRQFVMKEYKANGRTYRYPSHVMTPVFVWMWVKLETDADPPDTAED